MSKQVTKLLRYVIILNILVSSSHFPKKKHNVFLVYHHSTHVYFPEQFILVAKVRNGVLEDNLRVKNTQQQLIYVRKWMER